jgi:hypothetical protein
MRDIKKPHSSASYSQLLSPEFLISMNNQLFQFMNILIKVQKENMDQLNSVSVEKTQKLIGKIQKDPGVQRRMQQLEVMHQNVNNPLTETHLSPCNSKDSELGKRAFTYSGDTVFKKRKLNDEEQSKSLSRSEAKSYECSEMDECIDFQKVPEICSPSNESTTDFHNKAEDNEENDDTVMNDEEEKEVVVEKEAEEEEEKEADQVIEENF